MLASAKHMTYSMTTDAICEECGSDWSNQVSVVATTQWLQCDQTLSHSVKGVACESMSDVEDLAFPRHTHTYILDTHTHEHIR